MKEKILEFIKRRFPNDCNWLNGNCFYFALILKTAFPFGDIFYDPIAGHFTYYSWYELMFFDWNGIREYTKEQRSKLVKWDDFREYDEAEYLRIIRDCLD